MKIELLFFLAFLFLCNLVNAQKINVSSINSALKPVPKTAAFTLEGYYLWDPSVLKVGEQSHLCCSRWPEETNMDGWKNSEDIRAEKKHNESENHKKR